MDDTPLTIPESNKEQALPAGTVMVPMNQTRIADSNYSLPQQPTISPKVTTIPTNVPVVPTAQKRSHRSRVVIYTFLGIFLLTGLIGLGALYFTRQASEDVFEPTPVGVVNTDDTNPLGGDDEPVNSSVTINRNLIVREGADILEDLLVRGNLTVVRHTHLDTLEVDEEASIGGELRVSGPTNLNGGLNVTGLTSLSGGLNANGPVEITDNLSVEGSVDIGEDLSVGGVTLLGGSTTIQGDTHLEGNLEVDGTTTLNQNLIVGGDTLVVNTTTGLVSLSGQLTVPEATIGEATIEELTTTGLAVFTHEPTLAHGYSPWPTGAGNITDASLLINPATAVSDSNLLVAAVGGVPKFVVDY